MTDIKALALLSHQINVFQTLPEPPTSLEGADEYTDTVNTALKEGERELGNIKVYVENINEKLQQLRDAIQNIIKQNQKAIKEIFSTLNIDEQSIAIFLLESSSRDTFEPAYCADHSTKNHLKLAIKLQNVAKQLQSNRLDELIDATIGAYAKVKVGVELTTADFDNLNGCLHSWENAKKVSFEEENRRRQEEKKRREEKERRRREEAERRRREDEKRRKQEEEERKRREQEEAERKAEEERKKEAEEERLRKEEALRRQKEEEERRKQEEEEEEKRRREQEEAERRAEEERKKEAEEERLRKQERLRRQKEEEEMRKQKEEERRRREQEEAERKAEEERKKKEEDERLRREERHRRKQEEEIKRKQKEERKKREQEEAERKAEEERKRKEEEERLRKQEKLRRLQEEERRRNEKEERKRREQEEADRKAEEERKKKEEEERLRKEEILRRKQEAEKRRKQEEEERKRREQEEAERRAEEESKRKEEEERLRKEEELRRQQEEEERKRREEEERKQLEEEKRRRKAEEEMRREEERQRREAERREQERLKKEAEERAFRQDPNNWRPVVYTRNDHGEVDGRRAYHGGISCIVTSPPGGITEENLQCTASDELDSVIEIMDDAEKPVSSLIDIKSRKDSLHSEYPSRIYIPHYPALSTGEEIVVKVSIDGNDWETAISLPSTSNMHQQEKLVKRLAGIEVNDFTSIKAVVVCRPKYQTIVVDKPGISVYSSMDRNLKLFVPRETFQKKTELRLSIKPVAEDYLSSYVKEIPDLENILAVNTFATLNCQKGPGKNIELDFLRGSQNKSDTRRGKTYQLYACGDKVWKLADVEYKGHQDDLTISLPTGKQKYVVMEVEVPSSYPKEGVPKLVEDLYTCVNRTRARLIVRQQGSAHEKCVVRIVKEDQCKDVLDLLDESGFTAGPDLSVPFCIQEGQHVTISCTGNIEAAEETNDLIFLSYLGGLRLDMTLKVKDSWKQKDLPSYVGNIICSLLSEQGNVNRTVEVTVSIPKLQRERTVISFTPVRFPYYLTSLSSYVSHLVCKEDENIWEQFLISLLGEDEFHSKYRLAKRKLNNAFPEQMCKAILLDWMKGQAAHDDKILPVMKALRRNRLHKIAEDCHNFAQYHREHMTDETLKDIASGTSKDTKTLGAELELDETDITRYIWEHSNDELERKVALLMAWRESDLVVKYGDKALDHLKNICV